MKRFLGSCTFGGGQLSVTRCVAAVVVLGFVASVHAQKPSARQRDVRSVLRDGLDMLGVTNGVVVELPLGGVTAASGGFMIPIEGASRKVTLSPHSVRSDAYQIEIQLAGGSFMNVEPSPVRTLRGTVEGIEGSVVAASWHDGGLFARIVLPHNTQYWVEPLGQTVTGAESSDHIVYRGDDVIPGGGECRTLGEGVAGDIAEASSGTTAAGGALFIAELAIDVDFDFFNLSTFQSQQDSIAAVEDHINSIIAAMNVQYERDVLIRHVITEIIIRTAEPDPYHTTCIGGGNHRQDCTRPNDCPGGSCVDDPEAILTQFRDEWRTNQLGVPRDVAQLFTGKILDGNTIGIAYIRSVCLTGTQYGVVESACSSPCSNFACKTDLSAHELGHNWGALHCGDDGPGDSNPCSPSCPGFTMNCAIGCANAFEPDRTAPDIIAHRDSRICLDAGDELNRIIILVDPPTTVTVAEGSTLQFDALADFVFGDDLIVTDEAQWSVEPPEVGVIDTGGMFTAAEVDGGTCATIRVSFTSSGVTKENAKTILIEDLDNLLAVATSDPLTGSIDARQPGDLSGRSTAGWQTVDITFNGDTCLMRATDFAVSVLGGVDAVPTIDGFERPGPRAVTLRLSRIIEPGAWTTISRGDISVSLGFLPGDVTGNGLTDVDDLAALMSALTGPPANIPIWSSDLDRSGVLGPADILRLIDLLGGAGVYDVWNGQQLP